ncbi:M3 family oligoendopeptidase [Deinococcus sp. SDU3-2]|uniref:M3 family oligoendopeptidase n=1 Tax=Deinococcus terrestris TaxID=2651870 RepID=A0A7X1TT19_9DEIO|nr:M3 family metallopeptidase [Deinococcus terrestris]MPY68064.1 M3 family oligoendopeptidase [Deinococcus terrestris]
MTVTTQHTWEERYQHLHGATVDSDQAFREWLLNWAALESEVYEHNTALVRDFQANTSDEQARAARHEFLTQHAPRLRTWHDQTALLAVSWGERFAVPADWRQTYLYLRVMARQAEQPSGDLEGQVEVIAGEITSLYAQRRYEWNGEEVSAAQLSQWSTSPDRDLRRAAFLSQRASLARIAPEVVGRYRASLELRREMARRSGEATVHRHLWQGLERFDYSPAQVQQFRANVRQSLAPLLVEFREKRRELLGVDRLHPWDLAVNPFSGRALPRFGTEAEVMQQVARTLAGTLPGLSDHVTRLYAEGHLDLTARPGKAARSYTDYLAASHQPYVQMNLHPTPSSYQVLFHELGHVAQLTGVAPGAPFWHAFPGVEMREFVAQVFELWSLDRLPEFFDMDGANRYRVRFYEQTLSRMCAQCVMDEFQEWFYTTPEEITAVRLAEVWQAIQQQYPTGVDRSGEAYADLGYLSQQLVRRPLVGIEYALAWGWAFEFVETVRLDPDQAFGSLAQALRLGNTRPLPELLHTAGVNFSFSPQRVQTLSGTLRQALMLA